MSERKRRTSEAAQAAGEALCFFAGVLFAASRRTEAPGLSRRDCGRIAKQLLDAGKAAKGTGPWPVSYEP